MPKKTTPPNPKNLTQADVTRYLEAAYLYYLHADFNIVLMHDLVWDQLGRDLEAAGLIERSGSLFYMKEQDYPQEIRDKYKHHKPL